MNQNTPKLLEVVALTVDLNVGVHFIQPNLLISNMIIKNYFLTRTPHHIIYTLDAQHDENWKIHNLLVLLLNHV